MEQGYCLPPLRSHLLALGEIGLKEETCCYTEAEKAR